MVLIECSCGYSCGTEDAWLRHLQRFEGTADLLNHRRLGPSSSGLSLSGLIDGQRPSPFRGGISSLDGQPVRRLQRVAFEDFDALEEESDESDVNLAIATSCSDHALAPASTSDASVALGLDHSDASVAPALAPGGRLGRVEPSNRLHTIFGIDISSSMAKSDVLGSDGRKTRRVDAAIERCLAFIDLQTRDRQPTIDAKALDRYSVIAFNGESDIVVQRNLPDIAKKELLAYKRSKPTCVGEKKIGCCISRMWSLMHSESEHVQAVIVSDGKTSDWNDDVLNEYVEQIHDRPKTKVYTIGFGHEAFPHHKEDFTVLHQIAGIGRGFFLDCQLTQQCLKAVFTDLHSSMTSARDADAHNVAPSAHGLRTHDSVDGHQQRLIRTRFTVPRNIADGMRISVLRETIEFTGRDLTIDDFSTKSAGTTIARATLPCYVGGMRLVFAMRDLDPHISDERRAPRMFCKESKYVDPKLHTKEAMRLFVKNHSVGSYYASQFNAMLKDAKSPRIRFSKAWLYTIEKSGKSFTGELYIPGSFTKWTGNNGYRSAAHSTEVPEAFMHFTYCHSGGKLMVADIQGVFNVQADVYCCTDPQVHSKDRAYGQGDFGEHGMRMFFDNHCCGTTCHLLGITSKNMLDPMFSGKDETCFNDCPKNIALPADATWNATELSALMMRGKAGALSHSSVEKQKPLRKLVDDIKEKLSNRFAASLIHEFSCLQRWTSGPQLECEVVLLAFMPMLLEEIAQVAKDMSNMFEATSPQRAHLPCQPTGAKGFTLKRTATTMEILSIEVVIAADVEAYLSKREKDGRRVQRSARGASIQNREKHVIQSLSDDAKAQGEQNKQFLEAITCKYALITDALALEEAAKKPLLYTHVLLVKHWVSMCHIRREMPAPPAWLLELMALLAWQRSGASNLHETFEAFLKLIIGNRLLIREPCSGDLVDLTWMQGMRGEAFESLATLRSFPADMKNSFGAVNLTAIPKMAFSRVRSSSIVSSSSVGFGSSSSASPLSSPVNSTDLARVNSLLSAFSGVGSSSTMSSSSAGFGSST